MIISPSSIGRFREGPASLSHSVDAITRCTLSRRPDGVDAQFPVGWRVRLRFTRDVFAPGNGMLAEVFEQEAGADACRLLAVVDGGVADAQPGLIASLRSYVEAHGRRLRLAGEPLIVPGGERAKNDQGVFESIVQTIHDAGLCRRSYVVVIGGGAVLDAAGFAAAVAHRGVRLIRIPTTALSQDDSGVGVKNSINAFGKKNFLGTFAPPWAVLIDSNFLTTLSSRDWRSGLSECVKVALVKDAGFFDQIANSVDALNARDLDVMSAILRRSAEMHLAHIVLGGDPFELTAARPLDFGHWAAHKVEQITDFRLRHGEAVSIGLCLDSTYSMLRGWLRKEQRGRIVDCLGGLGLPLYDAALQRQELLDGLDEFRQHLGGRLTIAMLRGIGVAFDVHEVDRGVMSRAVEILAAESLRLLRP